MERRSVALHSWCLRMRDALSDANPINQSSRSWLFLNQSINQKVHNESLRLIDWFSPPSEKLPHGGDFRVGPKSDRSPRTNLNSKTKFWNKTTKKNEFFRILAGDGARVRKFFFSYPKHWTSRRGWAAGPCATIQRTASTAPHRHPISNKCREVRSGPTRPWRGTDGQKCPPVSGHAWGIVITPPPPRGMIFRTKSSTESMNKKRRTSPATFFFFSKKIMGFLSRKRLTLCVTSWDSPSTRVQLAASSTW